MTAVTIVYHSNSGHTARLAEAVEHGAASVQGARVSRLEIAGGDIVNGRWENNEIMTSLDASDAIIFGAPTSMGDVSGQMKCFIDATSGRVYPRAWANKLAAGFTCSFYSTGDKVAHLQTFLTLSLPPRIVWVGPTQPPLSDASTRSLEPTSH